MEPETDAEYRQRVEDQFLSFARYMQHRYKIETHNLYLLFNRALLRMGYNAKGD